MIQLKTIIRNSLNCKIFLSAEVKIHNIPKSQRRDFYVHRSRDYLFTDQTEFYYLEYYKQLP